MNYFRIYDQLIDRARNRDESNLTYVERHHVIPRCLGGSDERDNLVALTLEEHFVAHQLLTKMFPLIDALAYAANMMGNRTNKQYGWLKRQFVEREKATKTGKKRSRESVEKQRATMLAQYASGERISARLGTVLTDEHKRKVSEGNKGKTVAVESRSSLEGYILRHGEEEGTRLYRETNKKKDTKSLESFIARLGEDEGTVKFNEWNAYLRSRTGEAHPMYGKKHSEETKAKWRKPKPKVNCPHCGKEGGEGIMKRWHFDNCKQKKEA